MRIAVVAELLFLLAICGTAFGQNPPNPRVEHLYVRNGSEDTILVHIRATGSSSPSKAWQKPPTEIGPGEQGKILLWGYQPFEVAIQQKDGTYFVSQPASLCKWMERCALTKGRESKWVLKAFKGKWIQGIFTPDDKTIREIPAVSDEDNVIVDFSPIYYETPRQPERPPRKK